MRSSRPAYALRLRHEVHVSVSIESIRQVADDRLAIDVDSAAEGQVLAMNLRTLPYVIESVGGIRTVELMFDIASTGADEFRRQLATALCDMPQASESARSIHDIPVHYGGTDGPDLEKVCGELGLSREAFIEQHTAAVWSVAMLGFTPGFAYLDGAEGSLAVPRRSTPRTTVPAGSVGLAGGRTGLYALPGPGGWQLVGRTDAALFRPDEPSPFLLAAGDQVRFTAVEAEA